MVLGNLAQLDDDGLEQLHNLRIVLKYLDYLNFVLMLARMMRHGDLAR